MKFNKKAIAMIMSGALAIASAFPVMGLLASHILHGCATLLCMSFELFSRGKDMPFP